MTAAPTINAIGARHSTSAVISARIRFKVFIFNTFLDRESRFVPSPDITGFSEIPVLKLRFRSDQEQVLLCAIVVTLRSSSLSSLYHIRFQKGNTFLLKIRQQMRFRRYIQNSCIFFVQKSQRTMPQNTPKCILRQITDYGLDQMTLPAPIALTLSTMHAPSPNAPSISAR